MTESNLALARINRAVSAYRLNIGIFVGLSAVSICGALALLVIARDLPGICWKSRANRN